MKSAATWPTHNRSGDDDCDALRICPSSAQFETPPASRKCRLAKWQRTGYRTAARAKLQGGKSDGRR